MELPIDGANGDGLARSRIGDRLDAARIAALGLATDDGSRDETGPDNLAWMCETAKAGLAAYPVDKLGRWLGFVDAALIRRGVRPPEPPDFPGPPAEGLLLEAHEVLFDRYATIARVMAGIDASMPDPRTPAGELSYWLGRLQGDLVCRGLASVMEERDFSRPLFHAAYARTGDVPPTLDGPGSPKRLRG